MNFVPVKSKDGEILMPTTPTRAGMMIKCGDATPYWSNGIFSIRLNREPSKRYKQDVCVGVDPGRKKKVLLLRVLKTPISTSKRMLMIKLVRKSPNVLSFGEVGVHGNVLIARIGRIAVRINRVSLLARVRDGIGNSGY